MGRWIAGVKRVVSSRGLVWPRDDYHDGIIVLTEHPPRPAIGPRGFLMVLAAFLLLKASIIVRLGPETHAAAIEELQRGAVFDRVAAVVMAPDAVSRRLVPVLGALPR